MECTQLHASICPVVIGEKSDHRIQTPSAQSQIFNLIIVNSCSIQYYTIQHLALANHGRIEMSYVTNSTAEQLENMSAAMSKEKLVSVQNQQFGSNIIYTYSASINLCSGRFVAHASNKLWPRYFGLLVFALKLIHFWASRVGIFVH